ncbi:gephyrin-like molybdotransferase Glp [Cellvibrio sp.]|uniref:molybdopterin molybdotransferase MoeA n=1 Tax=Cellvibrio sp. TaxID=1965322 RepID=UPI0039648835
MDCCSQPGLLPVAQAIKLMRAAITPITATENLSLAKALDRILSEPIYSAINVPGHNNSAMDGFALRHQDLNSEAPLKLIGQSLAGHPFKGVVNQGECVRIMTGAVIPEGADTVVMQENVRAHDDIIHINQRPKPGENIRRAGEDIAINSLVFAQGKRISPVDIGLLASLGVAEIKVFQRVKVAVLSTGDELKPLTDKLQAGDIYDSNRPTLIALLSRLNLEVIDIGCVADDPEKITAAFTRAINVADVVISSGGVSVGDADYTKEVLETLGNINFWKVAMKPGKPFAFGVLQKPNAIANKGWFFGLPGNPVSAVVTYHQLVLPALRYLAGEEFDEQPLLNISIQSDLKKQPGRADYQRGRLTTQGGKNYAATTGNQSSGVLSSVAQANCYIVLEQERGSVKAGEKVNILMFDKFLL